MNLLKQLLDESINDRGIFKAIFVIGMPGAGKSYTISKIGGMVGPRIVNTDRASEFLSRKSGKELNSETWKDFRDSTRQITKESLFHYLNGMLPLFIDGTSNDASNILHRIGILESLGYDVGIIHINVPLETALRRAEDRAKIINRRVSPDFIRKVYENDAENANFLRNKVLFFTRIDNDGGELGNKQLFDAFKKVQSFFMKPIINPIGQRTIATAKQLGVKYLTPEIMPIEVLKKKIDSWYKT